MKAVIELLNDMKGSGVIRDYALFGAMAQMRYTEPVATLDADVLVVHGAEAGLDFLGPIYSFCKKRGHLPHGEAILVGDWPVQFIPVFTPLAEEAVRDAETGEIERFPVRVVSAAHLSVIALSVGRAKDYLRILALLEAGAVNREKIKQLAMSHGLSREWERFERRFPNE